jgi:hypothetical protein
MPAVRLRGAEAPQDFSKLLFALWYARLRTFAQEVENGSIQMMRLARRRDWIHYGLRVLRFAAPRGSGRRRVVRAVTDRVNPRHRRLSEWLSGLAPSAIVVGSPGVNFLDQLVMIEARRLGIPVHCVVSSWDNLASRGPMIRRPATLSVWNAFMKRQAVEIHDYPAARTHVVGALQFTEYARPVGPADLEALSRRLGLPPDTPYALFVTGGLAAGYEAEDVAALAARLGQTRLAGRRLVVRVHPQAPVEPFRAIRHPSVVLDLAPRFASTGDNGLSFDRSEARMMAALLSRADAVFASWGTTALLEAAIFRRPIVQLRWMDALPGRAPEDRDRIRDFQRYDHMKPFDAIGCRVFSDSPDDLASRLDELFSRREHYAARCARAAAELATVPLGDAPRRTLRVFAELANRR